jgi:hypothetical protein
MDESHESRGTRIFAHRHSEPPTQANDLSSATFTHINFSSEVDSEDEIGEAEIGRIFGRVFEFADFKQHPVKINRSDEDSDDTTFSFSVRFTPVAAD